MVTNVPGEAGPRPPAPDDIPLLDPGIAQALRPLSARHGPARRVAGDTPGPASDPFTHRPVPEQRWDVLLVVDDSVSMSVVWHEVTREFITLMRQQSAFGSVRVLHMDDTADVRGEPVIRPDTPRSPATTDVSVLFASSRAHLVFVLTDGIGPAWPGGGAFALINRLARRATTAIVHMLPQASRPQTAVDGALMRVAAAASPASNEQIEAVPNPLTAALLGGTAGAVPLPVLGLTPGSLQDWAEFLSADGPRAVTLPVVFVWPGGRRRGARRPPRRTGPELVGAFRTSASPAAFELATRLAAAPLTVNIVHELRRGCRGAQLSHISEVFAAGLVEPIGRPGDLMGQRHATLDFVEGARAELLADTDRATIGWVIRLVETRFGGMIAPLRGLSGALDNPGAVGHRAVDLGNVDVRKVEAAVFRALSGRHLALSRSLDKAIANLPEAQEESSGFPYGEPMAPGSDMTKIVPNFRPAGSGAHDPAIYDPEAPLGGSVSTPTDTRRRPRNSQPAVMGNIAPRNPLFIGRAELLAQLHEQLQQTGRMAVLPQALHGTGGVGKTQLAMEYAYRHQGDYDIVWWIPAETEAQVSSALVELARRLDLPGTPAANTAIPILREALRRGEPYANWLLIFDNAESPHVVSSLFPTGTPADGNGNIIITSRNPEWSSLGNTLEVDVFTRAESIELLRKRDDRMSDTDADALAAALGDLPLAVEQIGAYVATTGISAADALQLVEDKLEVLDDPDQRPLGYPTTVAATWDLALDALRRQNPAALRLLQVCAFMAPEVSRALFTAGRGIHIDPELDEVLRDAVKLNRAIRQIARYSLIKIDHRHSTLQIHRLLQRVLVNRMSDEEVGEIRHGAHQLLAGADPNQPGAAERWPLYGALYPHVLASGAIDCPDSWVRELVSNLAQYLWHWGEHGMSHDLAQRAYDSWSASLGPDDTETLGMARWLGFTLIVVGEYAAAAELNAQTLERHERVLGREHEDTLTAASYVAADRRMQGRFGEALALSRDVHRTYERILGPDDPATLNAAHNLAVSLRLAGDFRGALDLDRATWAHKVEIYGANHLECMLTLDGVNVDRRELGDFVGARAAQEELIVSYRQLLGEDRHPALLWALRNLSVARRKAGDHERALALSSQTHLRLSERYGDKHPDTALAALNESVDRRENKDLRTARRIGEQARDQFRLLFGENHPHTMAAAVNLATTLRLSGEVNTALQLDEAALESLESRLGGHHLLVQACAVNLSSDLYYQGEFRAAYDRDVATLAAVRELLGENHPTTLACASNLSLDLRAIGRAEEADALLRDTVQRFEVALAPGHPAITAAINRVRASCDMDPMPL